MKKGFFLKDFEPDDVFNFADSFSFAFSALVFFFLILIARIWYLQIIKGDEFRVFSEKNLFKKQDIQASRGLIYDRDGKVLVENLPAYKAIVRPQYTENLEKLATDVGKVLQLEPKAIAAKVNKSRRQNGPFHPVDIKRHLTRDELFGVELLKLDHPGLDAQEFILRHYPHGKVGAHVLGYVGEISQRQIPVLSEQRKIKFKLKDIVGKNGLEEMYDTALRGQDGTEFIIVDAKGRKPEVSEQLDESISSVLKDIPAQQGTDIYTTIDSDLQKVAYDSFVKNDLVGSIVAMSPQGEILAWVSHPAYDPNEFSGVLDPQLWRQWLNNPDRPLGNKVIQDHFPPGSVFKPFVALASLQEGLITEGTSIYCPWRISFGKKNYHNWNRNDDGYFNVVQALQRSNNIFFFKQGQNLGIDNIAKYATALGLGEKTGVPLHRELPGLIPNKKWKIERYGVPWQPGENLSVSIGQGFVLTTSIQLAMAYSAIGLEGKVYQPQLIKKISSKTNNLFQSFEPKLLRDLTDPSVAGHIKREHFQTVKRGLHEVVNGPRGTANSGKIKGKYSIAGKTGTVQVRGWSSQEIYGECETRPRKYRHHGMFVGYAPSSMPEITVAVFTEHSCKSRYAIPVAKDVIVAYLKKYKNFDVEERKTSPKVAENE